MHTHNFIFSPLPGWRKKRHAWFWITAYLIASALYPPFNYAGLDGLADGGPLRYYEMVSLRVFTQILSQMFFVYPLLYWLVPRFFRKRKYISFVLLLLPLWMLTGLFRISVYNGFYMPFMVRHHFYPEARYINFLYGLRQTLTGPAFSGFTFIFMKLFRDWQVKQHENTILSRENFKAQVQLLQAQVHPHFLFNTLNNIYSFALSRSPKAGKMVGQLSDMLGYMAGDGTGSLVPLLREIKLISDYISLERVRYGEKLELKMEFAGEFGGKMVSPLLMIPFVENSFKHGASKLLNGSWINLRLWCVENRLHFSIVNNKPADSSGDKATGIGLTNVIQRLRLLYNDDHVLRVENLPGVFSVNLDIPLQTTT